MLNSMAVGVIIPIRIIKRSILRMDKRVDSKAKIRYLVVIGNCPCIALPSASMQS